MKISSWKNAFSLMEMMVVLLIVAIIAAASAPMVTKKMSRSAGTGDSPWVFTGLSNNIAYNVNGDDNSTVLIGTSSTPAGWDKITRLFIDSGDVASHIAFGNGNSTPLLLTADPQGRIGFSNANIPADSVAFGIGQSFKTNKNIAIGNNITLNYSGIGIGRDIETPENVKPIAIGYGFKFQKADKTNYDLPIAIGDAYDASTPITGSSVAIGRRVRAGDLSISIGHYSNADKMSVAIGGRSYQASTSALTTEASNNSVAIGFRASAKNNSVAIGGYGNSDPWTTDLGQTKATGSNSIAIGSKAQALHDNSIAIGNGVTTSKSNQIVLGDKTTTVIIPGHLVVGQYAYIGMNDDFIPIQNSTLGWTTPLYTRVSNKTIRAIGETSGSVQALRFSNAGSETTSAININNIPNYSDRRLKNVGKLYTSGIEDLKKLEFFHYTFKDDKDKTPRVGVMAQDLQKVFPDAVTKGEDGYLRIRWEDMFYAVINSIKELDKKICEVVDDIVSVKKTIESQKAQIESLEKSNAELEKRIMDLEKSLNNVENTLRQK